MEESNTLDVLLDKAGKYHPLYGGGLATHLPMVMIALTQLNASQTKLNNTFDESVKGLEHIGDLDSITPVKNIEHDLGNSNSFRSYLKYFKGELRIHGIDTVLKQSLPVLISGVAASAFHALIRLAYAIEANNKSEIAIALAYWCAEYQSFELSIETSNESLEEILTRLAPVGVNHNFSPRIIVNRMSEIGSLLKHENCVIQPHSVNLSDLKKFALKAYCAKDDFTLLHTVTGCHAFSIVMPYIEYVDIALKELWKAILVAYLSTGLDYADKEIQISENSFDFPLVISSALKSNDSHVIKLVYTCFCEYTKDKDPLYYTVAKRMVSQ
ncbi:questin oxidase family protein [Colwellia psychrerythraea]|uniref:Questin oxidase family protein n=1 Tax=Colwellia psychrerythraea TaxID=28229 RepID=A0A099KVR2_COLPS|nr:questin oxidase family protein [Colwellia psychrerythraea]KGJ93743.1 protein of unknown function DUF4243 [Colwellia psychrerythraea]